MPNPEYETYSDIFTKKLFEESVIYVDRKNTIESLVEVYKKLYNNRSTITEYKSKISNNRFFLNSWNERIDKEIEIISNI